ncbi:hypothetical protein [Sphingobacterium sp. LRF_L2]|uniref:hypothetical protein n=1 Tax=Sphingobacterium sp. LRF_L2 TaxID=3369421 RepID=UPI003F63B074
MKNIQVTVSNKKRPYKAPIMEYYNIELECSIAAGSAFVNPTGPNGQAEIYQEWDVDVDDNRSINF